MTEQTVHKYAKEYPAKNGVLIIENIFHTNKSKADLIMELIDCDSQIKEAENENL